MASPRLSIATVAGVAWVVSGCGGGGANGADAGAHEAGGRPDARVQRDASSSPEAAPRDAGRDASTIDTKYPAPHPSLPQVTSNGGATLSKPVFVPVTFPADPYQNDIAAFTAGIGETTYWTSAVSQYGVGAATSGKPVVLTDKAQQPPGIGKTLANADIQTWLQSQVESRTGALTGTNSPSTVYVIYFPAGTTITFVDTAGTVQSCTTFGSFHSNFTSTGTGDNISYAVIPRCGTFSTPNTTLSGLDAVTGLSSHEFLESATDPEPSTHAGSDAAYVQPDQDDLVWGFELGGGEIADMCAMLPDAFFKPTGFDYTVQRAWSNASARASQDPCQPSPTGEVFFDAVAVLPSTNLTGVGPTHAVSIPVHTSKTVEVDLFSDGPTPGPWTVQAIDGQAFLGGKPALSFRWDSTSGRNGDKLHLTITSIAAPAAPDNVAPFLIESRLGSQSTLWIGLALAD
jgi:hypothetical protein